MQQSAQTWESQAQDNLLQLDQLKSLLEESAFWQSQSDASTVSDGAPAGNRAQSTGGSQSKNLIMVTSGRAMLCTSRMSHELQCVGPTLGVLPHTQKAIACSTPTHAIWQHLMQLQHDRLAADWTVQLPGQSISKLVFCAEAQLQKEVLQEKAHATSLEVQVRALCLELTRSRGNAGKALQALFAS